MMPRRIRYSFRIPADLAKALSWYRKTAPLPAERFKQAVQKTLRRIEKNPALFAVSFEPFRIAPTKPFPYLIIYDFDDTTV